MNAVWYFILLTCCCMVSFYTGYQAGKLRGYINAQMERADELLKKIRGQ